MTRAGDTYVLIPASATDLLCYIRDKQRLRYLPTVRIAKIMLTYFMGVVRLN